jgi:hypothetical protein
VESEVRVEALGWNLLGLVNIDNSPSLIDMVVSLPDNNFLSFKILSLEDIKCLLVLDVDEVISSVPEDLPPVRVSAPDSHFLRFSTGSDIP